MRILNAKKSKYYGAALSNLESAKRCYLRASLGNAWQAVVAEVRGTHHRKVGFMADFERMEAGHGPSDEPSFLDRARGPLVPGNRALSREQRPHRTLMLSMRLSMMRGPFGGVCGHSARRIPPLLAVGASTRLDLDPTPPVERTDRGALKPECVTRGRWAAAC